MSDLYSITRSAARHPRIGYHPGPVSGESTTRPSPDAPADDTDRPEWEAGDLYDAARDQEEQERMERDLAAVDYALMELDMRIARWESEPSSRQKADTLACFRRSRALLDEPEHALPF